MRTEGQIGKSKIANLYPTTSVITFNVNGLNTPNYRQRLSKQIKKQDPTIRYPQELQFSRLKVNGW